MARRRGRLTLALAAALLAGPAAAVPRLPSGPGVEAAADGTLPWSEQERRPFLALQADAGTVLHARGLAGWGQPHWLWGGLIVDGWVDQSMATGTVGARLALLLTNLDVHWRTTRYWDRLPMPALSRHTALATGGSSTNHAWDLDLFGVVPTPGGYATYEVLATRMIGGSTGQHYFDEGVHGIVQPPWYGMGSLGWVASLAGGQVTAGATADASALGRGGTLRWRAGPLATWDLSPHWSVKGQVLFTLAGPDDLGTWLGMSGGLVVSWRTATGLARPAAATPP